MERMAWKGRIKPGKKAEYIRRHNLARDGVGAERGGHRELFHLLLR